MLELFAGLLLALLFVLKLLATHFGDLTFFAFINDWFVWLFSGVTFLLVYFSTKRFFWSALISAIVGLVMRVLLKA